MATFRCHDKQLSIIPGWFYLMEKLTRVHCAQRANSASTRHCGRCCAKVCTKSCTGSWTRGAYWLRPFALSRSVLFPGSVVSDRGLSCHLLSNPVTGDARDETWDPSAWKVVTALTKSLLKSLHYSSGLYNMTYSLFAAWMGHHWWWKVLSYCCWIMATS